MTKKKETTPAVIGSGNFPVLSREGHSDFLQVAVIEAGLTLFDMPQLRLPSASGPPVMEIGGEPVKEFDAVFIATRGNLKKFYAAEFGDDEAGPPDCSSKNGKDGFGVNAFEAEGVEPSHHECEGCPLNEFGSARNGKGKACSDYILALIFREGSSLPNVLSIPATSTKNWRRYCVSLLDQGERMSDMVLTTVSIEKGPNSNVFSFEKARNLEDDEIEKIKETRQLVAQFLAEQIANV